MICKILGVKNIIIHSHSSNLGRDSGFIKLRRKMHNCSKLLLKYIGTKFLACSEEAKFWMYDKKIWNNVIILKNTIECDKYAFDLKKRSKIRNELNIGNEYLIGNIGRLVAVKNQKFLIQIFFQIQKFENNVKLIIIGSGELKKELLNYIEELNIKNKVILIDSTDKIDEYLSAMDIFILPSLFEGLPLVGIEAQTSGLKCIFSDTITDQIKITDLCDFLSLNESEKWEKIILKHLMDYKKINFYKDKRSDYVKKVKEKGYDVGQVLDILEKIYREKLLK